jgi:hypothetical protein
MKEHVHDPVSSPWINGKYLVWATAATAVAIVAAELIDTAESDTQTTSVTQDVRPSLTANQHVTVQAPAASAPSTTATAKVAPMASHRSGTTVQVGTAQPRSAPRENVRPAALGGSQDERASAPPGPVVVGRVNNNYGVIANRTGNVIINNTDGGYHDEGDD